MHEIHVLVNYIFCQAGRKRWLGIRPRSGRWHRKTGRFGRKIRNIRPMMVMEKPQEPKRPRVYPMEHSRPMIRVQIDPSRYTY